MKRKFHAQGAGMGSIDRPLVAAPDLEWLDDGQKDDRDHQNGGQLIDYSIKSCGMPVLVLPEIVHPADQEAVQAREHKNKNDFCLEPTGAQPTAGPGEPQTKSPGDDHRRIDDDLEKAPLHHLECLRLPRPRLGATVIDKQPRQIEHSRHPGDDSNDVKGLEPVVHHSNLPPHRAHAFNHLLNVRNRRLWKNAVAEIEYKRAPRQYSQDFIDCVGEGITP